MSNFLKIPVGTSLRTLVITEIEKRTIFSKDDTESEKIVFQAKERDSDRSFEISDIWVNDHKGLRIQGLWLVLTNGELSPASAIAKLLNHYEISTIEQFIGKEIKAYPDSKNFLVLVACDMKTETE